MATPSVVVVIQPVEMMDRAMAVTDAEPVRRRDCFSDVSLRAPHGGFHVVAPGEAGRDGRRQRAAGAVSVFGGDARSGKRQHPVVGDEIVDALRAAAMPALDQDRRATERQQTPALPHDVAFAFGNGLIEQPCRLRQVRRYQLRARDKSAP